MPLQEESYIPIINAYTKQDWEPLLNLIPIIERTTKFGELEGSTKITGDFLILPCWSHTQVVSEFLEIIYNMPIIINFDWGSWDEGREIAGNKDFNFDNIDIPTKCKLLTALVRNDRFCDGALVESFESGLILRILKSIEKQIESIST